MTSGTFGSMRRAELLSMTRQPALTASGARALVTEPPAAKNATSTPANTPGLASSTVNFLPAFSTTLPADRAEAKSRSEVMGKFRSMQEPEQLLTDGARCADDTDCE
jgi:hypothetical protein